MKILISLFFSITLAFSVFAEDITIIEFHDQTIVQILLNSISGGGDVNIDTNDDVNNDTNDDVNNDINNEELTNSTSVTEDTLVTEESVTEDTLVTEEQDTIIISEESNPSETITAFPDFWENADKDELLFLSIELKYCQNYGKPWV